MSLFYKYEEDLKIANVLFAGVGLFVIVFVCWLALMPRYSVWQQGLAGQAELKRAEQNRQITIEEAKALKESATLYADAEVERAKGVAKANEIIAGGLGGSEGYLRYLYINTLNDLDTQLIYVPTEAGLPVLEAGRF